MTAAASICVAALHSLPPPLFFIKPLGALGPLAPDTVPEHAAGADTLH